jgi:hypothetical protein
MIFPLDEEFLLISGTNSFLLIAKITTRFALCIETSSDEYIQGVEPGDLVVVSAPRGGAVEPAMMLIELVRTYHMPLLVLEKGHPGSERLSLVVSVAREIATNCSIQRGTHPEQHLVCSSGELAGITFKGTTYGVEISPVPAGITLQRIKCLIKAELA